MIAYSKYWDIWYQSLVVIWLILYWVSEYSNCWIKIWSAETDKNCLFLNLNFLKNEDLDQGYDLFEHIKYYENCYFLIT